MELEIQNALACGAVALVMLLMNLKAGSSWFKRTTYYVMLLALFGGVVFVGLFLWNNNAN